MSRITPVKWYESRFIRYWQYAAAILLLPLVVFSSYLFISNQRTEYSQVAYQEVFAPYGTHSRVNLPDGSLVWLNAGSSLKYPTVFDWDKRQVELSGEAYFEVESDPEHPFIVQTDGVEVSAVGTAFNVEAYRNDSIVAVTMAIGKVNVSLGKQRVFSLVSGERMGYNVNTSSCRIEQIDPYKWYAWKDGALVFRNDPLEEWIGNYFTTIDKHTIKLMAGYSYQEFNHRSFSSENANFPSDAMSYNNLEAGDWNMAAGRLGVSSLKEKEKTIGFPARLIYNYDDTYYLTASVRYEGNSKFGANHKWGWFPAASAAWRMSSLPAIKNIEAINDLKLRFSYGVTGRSGFPKYSALARYEQGGYWLDDNGQWTQAWGPTNNPNPDLHWEKQISYNLGVDFSLLKNKLSGSLDAYVKQGKEVISNYDAPLPPFMFDQIFTNVASTSSKGLELTLNWDVVNMKDFSYSTNLVASFTKSKLDKFSNGTYQKGYMDRYLLPAPGNPGYAQRLQDGVEIGSFYGLRYAGVDDNGNMLVWKDAKIGGEKILANGEASDTDKDYIGHGTPRYSLSWGNTFRYKGFDLSLYFQGRFDYQILNMYQMYYGLVAEPGMNLLEDAYGKNGHIKSGKVMCDYFLEDGDYFRLDNITLGWTPKLDTKWISNLRVYATVKNAFTITKYSVMDPTSVDINGLEPGISGLNVYPIARSFTFGIQISY